MRALGGGTCHVTHPRGRHYETLPVNASAAEARNCARFRVRGHTTGGMKLSDESPNPAMATALDLRWQPATR